MNLGEMTKKYDWRYPFCSNINQLRYIRSDIEKLVLAIADIWLVLKDPVRKCGPMPKSAFFKHGPHFFKLKVRRLVPTRFEAPLRGTDQFENHIR